MKIDFNQILASVIRANEQERLTTNLFAKEHHDPERGYAISYLHESATEIVTFAKEIYDQATLTMQDVN